MAFTIALTHSPANSISQETNSSIGKCPFFFRKINFIPYRNRRRSISCLAQQKPIKPMTEENILEAVSDFDGDEKSIPCLRTYENDLARLTMVGAVDFQQALTAAAADGGEAAGEHISAGMNAMVVETLFPGPSNKHSTISTRLQVPPSFAITSSDEQVISVIAEVICLSALESTKRHFFNETPGGAAKKFFPCFHTHKSIVSKDSSVTLYNLMECEIVANANILLQKFSSERANYRPREGRWMGNWLSSTAYSKLEQTGGPEFIAWLIEYVPAYKLQIDAEKLGNVKFEGWKKTETNTWEVFLTHSQMVGLSDMLDMYYEDVYTLPYKQLSSGVVAKSFNSPSSKRSISMSKAISMVLASGIFFVAIRILGQRYLPHLSIRKHHHPDVNPVSSSDMLTIQHQSMESRKLEDYCVSIVKRIKEFYCWPGDIVMGSGSSAWIGELPIFLKNELDSKYLDLNSSSTPSEGIEDEMKAAAQDIASYQVVLSGEGKIVGLQPTSHVAENQWEANPLAKELDGGKNLSIGLIERDLKISRPSDAVVLELLMSANPQSSFALVRPVTENSR